MDIMLTYIKTFAVGGVFCVIAQILIDKTRLTPARILSLYVVVGVILGALGLYEPLMDWAGAGASIPLTGFGNTLAQGVKKAVVSKKLIGVFTGGLTASAAGICASLIFGFLMSIFFKAREKK